jgi:DNA-directed RNA polymerase subunit K/omega
MAIRPIDLRQIDERAANIYEAAIVAAKRARQINDEYKIEFNALLSTVPVSSETEESEDIQNPAQLKIALEMDKREKPHIKALDELLEGNIEYEYKQNK